MSRVSIVCNWHEARALTPRQVELVAASFATIVPIQDRVASFFYRRLFELDPSLRPLFGGSLAKQGRKLVATLRVAVTSLDRFEAIAPALEALGRRHAGYGVIDRHYDTVAAALLWTLAQELGAEFTTEVEDAWTACYTLLADTMKRAAASLASSSTGLAVRGHAFGDRPGSSVRAGPRPAPACRSRAR